MTGESAGAFPITDPGDPRLDDFRDLARADRRPDRPGGRGLVIAEGVVVVRRLLSSRYPVRALLGVRRRHEELAADLVDTDAPFYVCAPELMAEVVGFHLNRGVLATADRVAFRDADELLARARTVAVLEGVGDHENLGALFRNAAALGVDAVLLTAGCADPLYRRSVRVSMGTVLGVPFAPLAGWVEDGMALLRRRGFRILALTPTGETTLSRATVDVTADGAGRIAVLLGSEGPGLSPAARAAADIRASIPMSRGVDSLNVATAGAIAFAALNQRAVLNAPTEQLTERR